MIDKLLPSFCTSGRSLNVGGITVHYFSCLNVDKDNAFDIECCFNLMVDLNQAMNQREHYLINRDRHREGRSYASAHTFIGRDGEIYKLVDFDKQAYHAGHSVLDNRPHCNNWCLGVELIGTNKSGFTDQQYIALAQFCAQQIKEHDFSTDCIAGHDTVRWAAIQAGKKAPKKYDPSGHFDGTGDNFDWTRLYEGIRIIEVGEF